MCPLYSYIIYRNIFYVVWWAVVFLEMLNLVAVVWEGDVFFGWLYGCCCWWHAVCCFYYDSFPRKLVVGLFLFFSDDDVNHGIVEPAVLLC